MKKILINAGIAGALALGVFATPSQASAIYNFASTGTSCSGSGCGTAYGSAGNLGGLTISDFTQLSVNVNGITETFSLTNISLVYTTGLYTLSGDLSCTTSSVCGTRTTGSSAVSLLTFAVANAGTYGSPAGSGTAVAGHEPIQIGTATNLNETAAFLTELGLTAPTATPTSFSGGASTSTATMGSSGNPSNITASNTLGFTTNQSFATPEPVSFVLFGTGLLAVGVITRRKQLKTVAVPAK